MGPVSVDFGSHVHVLAEQSFDETRFSNNFSKCKSIVFLVMDILYRVYRVSGYFFTVEIGANVRLLFSASSWKCLKLESQQTKNQLIS